MKKVSVLIECHNYETFIGKAIQSVLDQSYENFELIIVDDCSSDNSESIIMSFDDSRINYRRNPINYGFVKSRNDSLSIASGEYIAFLDADDYWLPFKLEEQVEFLEANKDFAATFSSAYLIDENDNKYSDNYKCDIDLETYTFESSVSSEIIRKMFIDSNFICHTSALLRKSIIDDVGNFDIRFLQAQDFDYWSRVVVKHPINISPKKLLCVRRIVGDKKHMSSFTKENSIRAIHECMFIIYNLITNVGVDVLKNAFSDLISFDIKDLTSEIFARYTVLSSWKFGGVNNKLPSLFYISTKVKSQEIIDSLKNEFGFSLDHYYKEMSKELFLYPIWYNEEYMEMKKVADERLKIIKDVERTFAWKSQNFLRKLKKILGDKN